MVLGVVLHLRLFAGFFFIWRERGFRLPAHFAIRILWNMREHFVMPLV